MRIDSFTMLCILPGSDSFIAVVKVSNADSLKYRDKTLSMICSHFLRSFNF